VLEHLANKEKHFNWYDMLALQLRGKVTDS